MEFSEKNFDFFERKQFYLSIGFLREGLSVNIQIVSYKFT